MEPDGRRTIYVMGYPKSGTTWLARLLGDVLNCPVGPTVPGTDSACIAHEGDDRPGAYHVRQGHSIPVDTEGGPVIPVMGEFAWRNLTDEGVVFMFRDPRDIVLSVAHHWGMSHRRAIDCMTLGEWPLIHGGGYRPYMKAWLGAQFPLALTSYEWLSADPEAETRRILDVLGLDAQDERLASAVARQSFGARKAWTKHHGDGLAYGKQFQLRFLRRGVVGAWRDELPAEFLPRIHGEWGDLMSRLGYTWGESE